MRVVKYGKLKGFYVEHGIQYIEEAERLGISDTEFSLKINRKNRDFSLDQARDICTRHGLDMDEYFKEPFVSYE